MDNHVFTSKVYNKMKVVIPKNSVHQIHFNGNNPNYYRVMNMGETVLYFATNNTPREDLYDFKVNPNSISNFAEPFTRDFLYALNPNDNDVEIMITYWEGDFDPAFIAFSETTLNVEGTVKTDGVINAINTPLPSGNNTIGTVNLPQLISDCISNISAICTSDLATMVGHQGTIEGLLMQINDKLDNLGGGSGGSDITELNSISFTWDGTDNGGAGPNNDGIPELNGKTIEKVYVTSKSNHAVVELYISDTSTWKKFDIPTGKIFNINLPLSSAPIINANPYTGEMDEFSIIIWYR